MKRWHLPSTLPDPDNYRIDGMPEHAETEFLRYGIDHLMKLVKDAQPSD